MARAYVGLGANLGLREETLRRAVELLDDTEHVDVLAVSELRETDPVGLVDQPRFLNGAAAAVNWPITGWSRVRQKSRESS